MSRCTAPRLWSTHSALQYDLPRFRRGKQRALQQSVKGVSLNVFLQHRDPSFVLSDFHDLRKIWAGNAAQLAVNLRVSAIVTENQARSVLLVPQKRNAAALPALECVYRIIFHADAR